MQIEVILELAATGIEMFGIAKVPVKSMGRGGRP